MNETIQTYVRLSKAEREDAETTAAAEDRDLSKQLRAALRAGWRALYRREFGSPRRRKTS